MFFDSMELLKKILAGILAVFAVVFFIALIFGGLFFKLDAVVIASWFSLIIVALFALAFIFAVLAFIGWFLGTKPFPGLVFLGALVLVVGACFLFLKLIGGPVLDLGELLGSIFSFLK